MAAPSETYVDPSIAGNSGAGTVGDPYGDLQYALDTMTRDATNGDRINVKAGTDEILTSAALDLTTYGGRSSVAGLLFQGYTSAAGDGGIGGIDCNGGAYGILASSTYTRFVNLDVHNSTSTLIVATGTGQAVIGCIAHNTTGTGIQATASGAVAIGNTVYDCTTGISGTYVIANTLYNGAVRDLTTGITSIGTAFGNILRLSGASSGVAGAHYDRVFNNSLYTTGTGTGINMGGVHNAWVFNNVLEGFDTAKSISFSGTTSNNFVFGNSIYDGGVDPISGGDEIDYFGDNEESLASSPFVDASSGDFTPQDVGSVLAGAYPLSLLSQVLNINRGAVQSAAGGGGGILRVGMAGGMNG